MPDRGMTGGRGRRLAAGLALLALAGTLGVFGGESASAIPPTIRPDALVRKTGGAQFLGDNVYNSTGLNQTKNATVATGGIVNYDLRMQNDGNVLAGLTPVGCAGTTHF